MNRIGIRREDDPRWSRCSPLVPDETVDLVAEGIPVELEPSGRRAFPDEAFETAGVAVRNSIDDADVILGLGPPAPEIIRSPATWMCVTHLAADHPSCGPLLHRLMEADATLIDLELLTDEEGTPLLRFGVHFGYVGTIAALNTLAARLHAAGYETPLEILQPPGDYTELEEVLIDLRDIARTIDREKLADPVAPLRIAMLGDGAAATGARRLLDALSVYWYEPDAFVHLDDADPTRIHTTTVCADDVVSDKTDSDRIAISDILTAADLVIATGFWTPGPSLRVETSQLHRLERAGQLRARVLADLGRVRGDAIETAANPPSTNPEVFSFDPVGGRRRPGIDPGAINVSSLETIPGDFSLAVSRCISNTVHPFVPTVARADFEAPDIADSGLPAVLRRGCVLWRGTLTERYEHLNQRYSKYGSKT